MAQAINFVGVNKVLGKPVDLTDAECGSLPVYSDGKVCVSCWELTDQEIEDVVKTRRMYCLVMSGYTQPPILLSPYRDIVIP